MERRDLEGLTREELIGRADVLGVPRPRTLTHAELMDEILLRTATSEPERARVRGFLGRARDLLSRVVERGLHLPETAKSLRSSPGQDAWPSPPKPFPTITLAEIYSAQGYVDRAVAVLDQVLVREPEHQEARQLRALLLEQVERGRGDRSSTARKEPAAPPPVASAAPSIAATPIEALAAPTAHRAEARDDGYPEPPARAPAEAPAEVDARLAAAIDDEVAALPERYDLDEIVGMPVDPETIYLYWEVRPTTLARARARHPEGRLVIRVVAVLPTWDGPLVEQRDIGIDALFGDVFVREIPPGSNIRMSAGWLSDEHFEPFAVGLEIAAPRAIPSISRHPFASRPKIEGTVGAAADRPVPMQPWGRNTSARASKDAALDTLHAADASGDPPGSHDAAMAGLLTANGLSSSAPERGGPLLDEGPQRFPSGTVPDAHAIARAVAATRGGSSELVGLSESPDNDSQSPFAGLARPRALGGSSELWRRFDHGRCSTPER